MVETDKKGDVIFLENSQGNKKYQIYGLDDSCCKVSIGDMKYRKIESINKYSILFNTNCIQGFTIWKDENLIEIDYWELHKAKQYVNKLLNSSNDNSKY